MHFVETNNTIVSSWCSFSNSLLFFLFCSPVNLDIITNMFLVSLFLRLGLKWGPQTFNYYLLVKMGSEKI